MTKALLGNEAGLPLHKSQLSDFVNNNAPKLGSGTPPDQSYFLLGQEIAFDLPDNLFTDPDNDTLSITVSGLPAGLGYTAGQGVAGGSISGSGAASGALVGSWLVQLSGSDPSGLSASRNFKINFNPIVKTGSNGSAADETVLGSSGNDQLSGGCGQNYFLFEGENFGHDVITDWTAGYQWDKWDTRTRI